MFDQVGVGKADADPRLDSAFDLHLFSEEEWYELVLNLLPNQLGQIDLDRFVDLVAELIESFLQHLEEIFRIRNNPLHRRSSLFLRDDSVSKEGCESQDGIQRRFQVVGSIREGGPMLDRLLPKSHVRSREELVHPLKILVGLLVQKPGGQSGRENLKRVFFFGGEERPGQGDEQYPLGILLIGQGGKDESFNLPLSEGLSEGEILRHRFAGADQLLAFLQSAREEPFRLRDLCLRIALQASETPAGQDPAESLFGSIPIEDGGSHGIE